MAETETETPSELRSLLVKMNGMELLDANLTGASSIFSINAGGWQRLDKLRERSSATTQAFVAMWFHPTTDELYEKGIAPAIEESGYRPVRIDRKEHINKIDDEIIAEIRRSHFVVADFTCEPDKVRGGVYFEAGFAMGLRIPVIWTCRDTTVEAGDLHFDTRQYSHLVWTNPNDIRKKLRARIGAVIGQGPLHT
jgi:nucleoside 2-deoxyribosyltransferase